MKLTLEKPVYGGDCLAHISGPDGRTGKAVFVPLTLPGETVTAHIAEDKRSFAKAEVDEILAASLERVAPPCRHFGVCGGCSYQHAAYPAQIALKRQILAETLERAGVAVPAEIETLEAEPWGYRNRIRLAFTPEGRFGYRGRRSHSIVEIEECPIAAPVLLRIAQKVSDFLDEGPHPVAIYEAELFTDLDETKVLLTLFCETSPASEAEAWLTALAAALPQEVAGIRLQLADGSLSPQILAATGDRSIVYTAVEFPYRVDHGAFFQVNRLLVDAFVALAASDRSGETAWDMFAGVGLFARVLAANFAQVVAVESAPASLAALEHNLLGTTGRAVATTTVDFLRRNRQQREPGPDLIVLDPPRAGLGDETTSLLNAIGAPEMVYVSCDPVTLARDLRALTQERYKIEKVTLVDMFPQTFHLETVVHLRRS